MARFNDIGTKMLLCLLQAVTLMAHPAQPSVFQLPHTLTKADKTKQSHDGAKFELVSNEVNDKDNKLAHEIHEQDEFERLLFDGADALRKEDPKFTRKVVQAVDRVGRILLRSNRINQFSKHLIATITEWFHLLTDAYENEKTIRSKLGSLNDQIYLKFRENTQIAMKLINRFAELSMDSGLTDSEQMKLLMLFTDMGGIDRVKAIALHEMGRQLDFNIPDDDSILKSISDLMVEKAFETKFHEIEANLKQNGQEESFPLQRKVRSVGFNEKSEWNANPDMSFNANDLRNEKKIKHDFRTRKHHKKTMQISHVPLPENGRNEKQNGQDKQDYKDAKVVVYKAPQKEKPRAHAKFDITKQLYPKFQDIYSDKSLTSKEKDRKMIQLITDMMSKPVVQESIVGLLERHLKKLNMKTATHLVLMAMERTSFGSNENVLEEMFDTWEPLLATTILLLSDEGLAKVCEIHASVEKAAAPENRDTLRLLTNKVFEGLNDRRLASRLKKGMDAATNGNHNAVLYALNDGQQKVVNVKSKPSKALKTKEKKREPQRQLFQQMG